MTARTDIGTIQLVIKSAVVIAILSLMGGIALSVLGYSTGAAILLGVSGQAVTGLFGLLAKTSTQDGGATHAAVTTDASGATTITSDTSEGGTAAGATITTPATTPPTPDTSGTPSTPSPATKEENQ